MVRGRRNSVSSHFSRGLTRRPVDHWSGGTPTIPPRPLPNQCVVGEYWDPADYWDAGWALSSGQSCEHDEDCCLLTDAPPPNDCWQYTYNHWEPVDFCTGYGTNNHFPSFGSCSDDGCCWHHGYELEC